MNVPLQPPPLPQPKRSVFAFYQCFKVGSLVRLFCEGFLWLEQKGNRAERALALE